MTKKNESLAIKIVDKLGEVSESTYNPDAFKVDVPQIGYSAVHFNTKTEEVTVNGNGDTEEQLVPTKTTEKDARKMAAQDIAKQLDAGSIILSDTWAEDNLGGVK